MRNTASFELFPDAPSERVMARARYLAREGRLVDAEQAYRAVIAEHPDLKGGWAECFELLRSQGRREDALRLAESARAQFGDSAFALALKGAALIELERYREALATLEQAAEQPEQRALADQEIAATRRFAFYAPRRPDELTPAERWFAETGTVVLASDDASDAPDDATLAAAFLDLARDSGWRFGQIVALGPALPVWRTLADGLRAPLVTRTGFDPGTCPLVVAQRPQPADAGWSTITTAVAEHATGLVFVLEQAPDPAGGADVIGVLADSGGRRPRQVNAGHALSEALHPASRLAGRRLAGG